MIQAFGKFSRYLGLFSFIALNFAVNHSAFALNNANLLASQFQKILKEKIPNSEVRIPNLEKLIKAPEVAGIEELSGVRLVEDRANGIAIFELTSKDGTTTKVQTPYQAWVKIPVAIHKIFPNTRLKKEDFRIDNVNVASGPARDYRGVLVYEDAKLDQMESRQTILESQFVVVNAIQKLPDLRKGDMVKLELISGDLSLTTSATIQENASVGERVHVITTKTKREIVGKVRDDHSVEVNL